MKSKIIAIIVATVIFVSILFALFFIRYEGKSTQKPIQEVGVKKMLEGESCNLAENRICVRGYSCEEGVCFPKIDYKEIIDPEEDKDLYEVAEAGPYENDYILHVDRLVVSEKLYVWIGNEKRPIWFKARWEKELIPYEMEVPKGNRIRIKLSNRDKLHPPEFRGKIYLTKP